MLTSVVRTFSAEYLSLISFSISLFNHVVTVVYYFWLCCSWSRLLSAIT